MAAEFVLTFAAEGILTKVSSLAAQELALASGFKAELEKLGESVSSIQDFLRGAAERPDDQGKAVEKWVKKLKQVAEDADDILDDFNYELLRRKVELHNHMKRKVLNFLSASNPLLFRLKMAHKIKKINNSLAVLKSQAAFINLVAKKGYSRQRRDRLQTDSFFEDGEKVVGREDAVTKIVTTLISSDNQQKNLSVMAIVGMAGLGKTTLAKSVYNEPAICTHFDKRIWVCVSNTFEVDTILSQLVDTVVPEKAGMKCQNAILEVLRKELTGNRYVLVLDDVWNKEKEKWDSLMSCLSKLNSNPGSCIIVTTRSTDVSTIAETLPRPELRNLSEEECWSIIKQRALNLDENGSIDAELERIGREIAEKCGGVPLVAKVLGSLLRSRASTVAEWSSILDNRLWELPEGEDRIMKVLKLSFDNLEPSPLKQCFAYCSMLRKDFEIERDNLIQLWMAQGLLQTSTVENHHEMEETGKEYFNILLNNSLIQEVIEGGTITKYTMHDLVHDLAEKVSESERLTQELNDDVRHVARSRPPSTLENMSEVTVGRLRSLFSNDQVPEIIFSKFKAMRVLSLDTAVMKELPNSFCKLKHLRYLDLSDTGITALPKSIGKLYNLQTLRMLRNWHLNKLPREMQNLINLRHLVLIDFCKCGELPILGHLPFLRDVEIRGMHNLKRFGSEIYGYDLVYEATREKETIVLFPALKTLSIRGCDELIEWMEAPTTTTTKVEVFPCLEKLKVEYCPSIGFIPIPHGMASLRELRVGSCDALSSIGQLDHCTSLQELKIYSCNALSSIGQLDHCTSLQELEINSCNALSSIGQLDHCTSLQELEIKWCNALSSIGQLDHCTSLQELRIDSCDALSSIGQLDHCTSLQKLWIFSCDALSSIGQLDHCTSLQELWIFSCDALSSIGQLDHCTSLQELWIFSCNALSSIGQLDNCTSLQELKIKCCHALSSIGQLDHCTSLQELEINSCNALSSIGQLDHCTSLQELEINSCNALSSIGLEGLSSLRKLRIEWCKALSSIGQLDHCTSLQELKIYSCNALSSIGQLDHCTSLQELKIYSCNALSSIGQLDHCTSLQELEINSCNALSSIGLEGLSSLRKLRIQSCHALSSIGQLNHCTSSQELEIKWCNALSSIGQLDHCTSLQELWIDSCDALSSIGLTSSQGLPSLRELIIQRCDGLSALPSGIENCTSLELLCVFECNGLQSLPDFRSFTSLRDLQLGSFWEDLDSFPDFQVPSQQLVSLELYGWPKLKSLPQQVQHLTSLTRLDISSFKGVETLPEWLGNLASLMDLRISNCENLKYLPSLEAMQRLTKLQCLEVIGCPLLEERCTKDSGEEWPKISHIPCIEIDY